MKPVDRTPSTSSPNAATTAADTWPGRGFVRDLAAVTADEASIGGLAVVVPDNAGSLTQAGHELERLRPSLGRDLLQRAARLGDHQAIRQLLQIGAWTAEDVDIRSTPEPPAFLLYEAAQDPLLTDPTTRTRLLLASLQRGATDALQPLQRLIETSPVNAAERAEVATATYTLASATTVDSERRSTLDAAAVRDHIPALLEQLKEPGGPGVPSTFDSTVALRLAQLGEAVTVAQIVDPINHEAAIEYLDMGVRRDEPAAMRALALQLQGQNPERAHELRELAEQREEMLPRAPKLTAGLESAPTAPAAKGPARRVRRCSPGTHGKT